VTDIVQPHVRSRMMSGIKGKNSKPEILVRHLLFAAGFRFRLHRCDLPGTPDIVLPGRKIVIFVHGCFWHAHNGCRYFKLPSTRPEFWKTKLQGNVDRDQKAITSLISLGWRVLSIWECATRESQEQELAGQIIDWIDSEAPLGEIGSPTNK
jgi:DNA mismatch endonuclease (patch repair protein)